MIFNILKYGITQGQKSLYVQFYSGTLKISNFEMKYLCTVRENEKIPWLSLLVGVVPGLLQLLDVTLQELGAVGVLHQLLTLKGETTELSALKKLNIEVLGGGMQWRLLNQILKYA